MTANATPVNGPWILGLDQSPLVDFAGVGLISPEVIGPLQALRIRAKAAGFDLQVASGYRDFYRQLMIWNAKACGARAVLDDAGQPLVLEALTDSEKVLAILRWSALPGASRHHWGTDFDVYDAAAMPAGYQLQLNCDECEPGGVFGDFHQWLTEELLQGNSGFFRPYAIDNGGVAPEPWHLSYAPVASRLMADLSPALLRAQISVTDIALKQTILNELDRLFDRFVVSADNETTT